LLTAKPDGNRERRITWGQTHSTTSWSTSTRKLASSAV